MIPYIGNKSSLSDFILPNCPKNPRYWIEPFGGMMGLFFSLNLDEYPQTKFIYNDVNEFNCELMECLKEEEFHNIIIKTNVNEKIYLESFDNLDNESIYIRALSWLIILSCGDIKDLMIKNFKGSGSFELLKYKITKYIEYFKRLKVDNLDYKKLIKKYDTRRDVFFYFDPPYKGYEKYYVNHNFDCDNHFELFNILKDINSKWILSYYKFKELEDWYSEYKIISKKHNLSEEYLIINN